LRGAVECLPAGDVDTGKAVVRDYIDGAFGFEKLNRSTHTSSRSPMRMFGPTGNPRVRTLLDVLVQLRHAGGLRFELSLKG
jgi:DNA-binding phage protein